jgi:predicted transposase YbfD/YdcC
MTVPITHTNAKGKTFYLHQGTTKTGKPTYHFSTQSEGTLAESIPAGFEIYENPNAQVFLRRIPPKIIPDEERQVVEDGMRKYASVQEYKIDVRGNAIVVYPADQDIDALVHLFQDVGSMRDEAQIRRAIRREITYSLMLQFVLSDDKPRAFVAQRYCSRGAVDDWIDIGQGPLATLVKQYVTHLGKESYFDLC